MSFSLKIKGEMFFMSSQRFVDLWNVQRVIFSGEIFIKPLTACLQSSYKSVFPKTKGNKIVEYMTVKANVLN